MWTEGNPYTLLMVMYISPTIVEINIDAKNIVSYVPARPHLGSYTKGFKSTVTEILTHQCILQHYSP